jgi:hypothetical protein
LNRAGLAEFGSLFSRPDLFSCRAQGGDLIARQLELLRYFASAVDNHEASGAALHEGVVAQLAHGGHQLRGFFAIEQSEHLFFTSADWRVFT